MTELMTFTLYCQNSFRTSAFLLVPVNFYHLSLNLDACLYHHTSGYSRIATRAKYCKRLFFAKNCNVPQGAIPRSPRRAYALDGGVPPRLGGRRTPRRAEHLRRSPSAPGRRSPSARGCCSRRPLPSARCWRGRRQSMHRRRWPRRR